MGILWRDADLVVSGSEIDLAENLGSVELVYEVVDLRKRVPVLDSLLVEGTVVYTKAESSIFLVDKEYWSAKRRGTWLDESFGEEVV